MYNGICALDFMRRSKIVGRTARQNSRKRIQTFHQACTRYNAGERKSPPRLRVTLPDWEKEAMRRGVKPEDVFDDFANWPEAQKIARDTGATVEDELEGLWNRHKWRIQYRDAKKGVDMVETIRTKGIGALEKKPIDPLAPRLFLNKYRNDSSLPRKEQTMEEKEKIIENVVRKFKEKNV